MKQTRTSNSVLEKGRIFHVYPVEDVVPHTSTSMYCECNPKIQREKNGNWVVVHNSYDWREYAEANRIKTIH